MNRDTARFFLNQPEKMLVETIKKAKILNNRAVTIPQFSFCDNFCSSRSLVYVKIKPLTYYLSILVNFGRHHNLMLFGTLCHYFFYNIQHRFFC